jgi:hypothetical protein
MSLSLKTPLWYFAPIVFFGLASSVWLIFFKKEDLVPQLWLSIVAAVFAFFALIYSKEKFRLDLLDRRFEIYQKALEFCTVIFEQGSLDPNERNREAIIHALQAAHESFRGIGHHKTKALFGEDVSVLFDKINKSFSYISTHGRIVDRDPQTYWKHVNFIAELPGQLPELFKPYIYFGDYKNDLM